MTDEVKMRLLKPTKQRGIQRLVGAEIDVHPKKVQWFIDNGIAERVKDRVREIPTIVVDEPEISEYMPPKGSDREEEDDTRSNRRGRHKRRNRNRDTSGT